MQSLFGTSYDDEETIKNVKLLLKKYRIFRDEAKRGWSAEKMSLQSPAMSFEPKSPNARNTAEDKLLRAISPVTNAKFHEAHCRHAIEAIEDEDQRIILFEKYIMGKTNVAISGDLNLGKETFRRRLNAACLTFATIYGLEELRVETGGVAFESIEQLLAINDEEN